jgi:4-amino-4-deoxy-L-arabinose transferase-like glycosyltransferase
MAPTSANLRDQSRASDWRFSNAAISTAFAFLAAAAIILPLLGRKILANWDEAIYAEVAREFLGRNWLIPTWQFQPWLEKPPLGMWITAVFFHLFGATQFWARAASAFSGIGLVALLHWIAVRTRGLSSAWISTAILLTTFGFLRACRVGELDILLALGCYVVLWGLAQVRQGEHLGWYLFWIGFAFAVMTKGAASVTLVLSVGILFAWNCWRWCDLGRPFVLGALLFAALVLPWHIYMCQVFGADFLREYFGFQVLTRATSSIQGHGEPWWFYGKVLLARAAPWALLFPFALARAVRRRELREYFVFAVVVLAFFTLVATKTPKYIVPAYPALAMMTGDLLAAKMEGRRRVVWIGFILVLLAAFGISSIATRTLRRSLTETVASGNVVLSQSSEGRDLLLAALSDHAAKNTYGPVLLWQEDVAMQKQALLFYIHRPLQQVYLVHYPPDAAKRARRYTDPKPLTDFVTASPRLILLDRKLLPSLPGRMQFDPIVEGRTLIAGTIRLHVVPAVTGIAPENPGRKGDETKSRGTKIR